MKPEPSIALSIPSPAGDGEALVLPRAVVRANAAGIAPSFLRNVGMLTAANGFRALITLAQGIVVARLLEPERFGIASLVMAYPAIVLTVFSPRSSEVSVRYIGTFHARGDRERTLALCKWAYTIDLAIALLSLLAVIASGPWVARKLALGPEAAALMILSAAAFIPGALESTSYAVLAVLGRFPLVARIQGLSAALRTVLVIGLVASGFGVSGVVWGNAMATVVASLGYTAVVWMIMRRAWGASPLGGSYRALRGYRQEVFGFFAYNDLTALIEVVPKQLDVLFLGFFRAPVEVGYYKLAKSLASAAGYLVYPLQSVTYPELVRLWSSSGRRSFREALRPLQYRIALPVSVLGLICTPLIPTVIRVVIGEAYVPAIQATQLLWLSALIWLSLFWLRPALLAQGLMAEWFKISSLSSGLSLVGLPLAAAYGGYLGVAVCSLAVSVLSQGLSLTVLARSAAVEAAAARS